MPTLPTQTSGDPNTLRGKSTSRNPIVVSTDFGLFSRGTNQVEYSHKQARTVAGTTLPRPSVFQVGTLIFKVMGAQIILMKKRAFTNLLILAAW